MGYINGLDNRILVTENNILTNSNAILTKQPIINSENRLNSDVIGDGSISNLMFQSLYNIKTNESIQFQIDSLSNSKQNKINLNNKISTDLISYENNDLTTKINSLNSRLGGVENFNSNISNLESNNISKNLSCENELESKKS